MEFGPGLNVLTGETGAGKSMVVDSLALLSGARASGELIRTGAETLTVTGVFEVAADNPARDALEAAGLSRHGDDIVVRREVSRTGRNRVFINDEPVTLRLLSQLGPDLLRIHGQREELGLVAPDLQREWLDRQGGEEAVGLLERCARELATYRGLRRRLDRLVGDERARLERLDLLRFQTQEIEAAGVEPGEDLELRQKRDVLRHSEAIRRALGAAVDLLAEDDGSAGERLARAHHELREIQEWEPQSQAWQDELEEARIRVDEVATALGRRLEEVEADPDGLNRIEERLATLERLCRKYGSSCDEILQRHGQMTAELAELDGDEAQRQELESQVALALDAYAATAHELHRRRRDWSTSLVRRIRGELAELALVNADFAVRLQLRPESASALVVEGQGVEFSERGFDHVVFEFSPNPGEERRPLARVASGGELSRVYLALQISARGNGQAARTTLVFDEVDSGVGGLEAAILGRKLKRLARGGQVLAVTHLPQVASHGDLHFRIRKSVKKGRTHVTVEELADDPRVEEVARMLAGEEITPLSLSHARELIQGASEG